MSTTGIPSPGPLSPAPLPDLAVTPRPWFGRAWDVTLTQAVGGVKNPEGKGINLSGSHWHPEAPRVTFNITHRAWIEWWWADISIYNIDALTEQRLLATPTDPARTLDSKTIKQGDLITVKAGYQYQFDPDRSQIWEGEIFQPMWERQNGVDYKVTLRCVIGRTGSSEFLSFSEGRGASQSAIMKKMAGLAHVNVDKDQFDEAALAKTYPRGVVVCGYFFDKLKTLQRDNRDRLMQIWVSDRGLAARKLKPTGDLIPDLIYAPMAAPGNPPVQVDSNVNYTIVGTPRQTTLGVDFTVLLDARIRIGSIIRIDGPIQWLPQMPKPNSGEYARLEASGIYIAAQVRHIGDTRGNEWYTEAVCTTSQFFDNYGKHGTPSLNPFE